MRYSHVIIKTLHSTKDKITPENSINGVYSRKKFPYL